MNTRSFGKRIGLSIAAIAVAASLGVAIFVFTPAEVASFEATRQAWRPSEAWLLDRHGEVIARQRMDFSVRRLDWTPLESVSPALVEAVIDGEDRRFWKHGGVDWRSLLGALRDQGFSDRRRGASTLTMQVAKMLQPEVRAGQAPGAWRRKLGQMRLAHSLERQWTKRQILEAYLNLVHFRGELQGVDAASRVLAGKAPSGLTVAESRVLAALLPSPGAPSGTIAARACARVPAAQRAPSTCEAIRSAAASMLDRRNRLDADVATSSHLAPHLARALLSEAGERIHTTLDANIQRLAVGVLHQHLANLVDRNVRDGAVLVVENETGHVVAYVGSAGITSRSREVDGVRARRQAGSTLKPFLYALAVERGYLTAASLLDDSPIALDTGTGIYLPQNYDRDFKGLVSVRTALGNSLNVPAVRALVLTGVEPFRDRLRDLGYSTITESGEFYGFALALGSPEVSLWDQVQAYRTLARGGRWSALSAVAREGGDDREGTEDRAVLSPESAFIVTDILADRAARTLTFGLDSDLVTPFWSAVKTGTSKDMRDNWCIGFSSAYTVGVWIGNFEGDSMHDVSGVTGAAPVWNELMSALHAKRPSIAPVKPDGVITATTRFTPAVEAPRTEYFLATSSPPAVAHTMPAQPRETVSVAAVSRGGEIAAISSPANGMVIAVDPDIPPALQRVPLAARGVHDGMVLKLDGQLLGQATAPVLWSPERGAHQLVLEDAGGRLVDRVHFVVR